MLMEVIHRQYWETVCSLKHRDLGRLHKLVHSERRILASLDSVVCMQWAGREPVSVSPHVHQWAMEYSGGNGRVGGEAQYFVDMTGSIL